MYLTLLDSRSAYKCRSPPAAEFLIFCVVWKYKVAVVFPKADGRKKCRNPKARSEWELRIKNVENVIRYTVKCNKVCDDANMSSKGLLESVPWGLVFVGKRMSSRKSPRSNTGGDRRKTEEKSTLLGTYVEEE